MRLHFANLRDLLKIYNIKKTNYPRNRHTIILYTKYTVLLMEINKLIKLAKSCKVHAEFLNSFD